ncbi:exodeoxyribonuclease VII small subunit [Candidatus Azambacteria bacterium RBG_16_47_10]|uniref:Exodeoxyribonuclease 7 small subunit n=1 Tax=Candidatus Azambacteria bacterium RBG_16_47_10 TaxID=1797292 RepID=A0A1F5AZ05_9BACT|nr:MAG: exodeoxyribonuclease VII small subunit [Candidatus Azambacteria bacterium RBG_16_47_10]
MKKSDKTINFAQAYQRLEDITKEFESGDLSMEEGLKKFEEGLALAAECKQYLKQVENKIIDIKKKFNAEE